MLRPVNEQAQEAQRLALEVTDRSRSRSRVEEKYSQNSNRASAAAILSIVTPSYINWGGQKSV